MDSEDNTLLLAPDPLLDIQLDPSQEWQSVDILDDATFLKFSSTPILGILDEEVTPVASCANSFFPPSIPASYGFIGELDAKAVHLAVSDVLCKWFPSLHDVQALPALPMSESKAQVIDYDKVVQALDNKYFEHEHSALRFLAVVQLKWGCRVHVDKKYRHPKATQGQDGYAFAFRQLGLFLREQETENGHWHGWYWPKEKKDEFCKMQAALLARLFTAKC